MRFVWLLLCKCARLLADLYLCAVLPLCRSQPSTRCKLCCCQSRNWIRCGRCECVQIRVLQSHIVQRFFFFLLHFVFLFFFSHHIESSMKSLRLGIVGCFLWLFSIQVTGMLLCKGICQSLHIVYFEHGHIPVIKCDITINPLIQFRKVAYFSGELS